MDNEAENKVVQSTRGFNLIFLHSSLDDAELSMSEFRIYAHLSRRAGSPGGKCYSSVATVATVCKCTKNTVRAALVELESRKMLRKIERPGFTNQWYLTPPDEWGPLPKEGRGSTGDPTQKEVGDPYQNRVGDPTQKEVGEGTPREGNPSEEEAAGCASAPGGQSKKRKKKEDRTEAEQWEADQMTAFILRWEAAFEDTFGFKYVFQGGKDAGQLSKLIKRTRMTADQLMEIVILAWSKSGREFWNCQHAITIADFATRFNQVRLEVKGKTNGTNRTNGHQGPCRSKGTCNEDFGKHLVNFPKVFDGGALLDGRKSE